MKLARLAAAALLLLPIAACGDDDDDGPVGPGNNEISDANKTRLVALASAPGGAFGIAGAFAGLALAGGGDVASVTINTNLAAALDRAAANRPEGLSLQSTSNQTFSVLGVQVVISNSAFGLNNTLRGFVGFSGDPATKVFYALTPTAGSDGGFAGLYSITGSCTQTSCPAQFWAATDLSGSALTINAPSTGDNCPFFTDIVGGTEQQPVGIGCDEATFSGSFNFTADAAAGGATGTRSATMASQSGSPGVVITLNCKPSSAAAAS
jgi:hypothetical protein